MSQVEDMKENVYPLLGTLTPAPNKKCSDSKERTLTAQSGPNLETDSSFASLAYDKFQRKTSSNQK